MQKNLVKNTAGIPSLLHHLKNLIPDKVSLFLLFVLAIITIIIFRNLPNTFYQQDEWQILGHNFAQGLGNVTHYTSPLRLIFGEGRPMIRAVNVFFFGYLKFTNAPIAVFAVLTHFINGCFIYWLVLQMTRKKTMAFMSALFFLVNFVSNQAVTWTAAFGTVLSTSFILASMLSYFKALTTKKVKYFFISFFFFFISLFIKEIGIFLIFFYPIIFCFYQKKLFSLQNIRSNALFIGYGSILVLFRLIELIRSTTQVSGFVSPGNGNKEKIIIHLFLYPLTGLFQVFIPPLVLYDYAKKIEFLLYSYLIGSPLSDLVAQTIVADFLCLIGSVIIICIVACIFFFSKRKELFFYLLFAILLIVFSFLPYAVLDRGGSYMDSRYYYIAGIGGGMIIAYIVDFFSTKKLIFSVPFLLFFAVLVFWHGKLVSKEIDKQVIIATERRTMLKSFQNEHPTLGKQTVFYVTGDKEYYIAGNNVPMQQGMGYTLLVYYFPSSQIPKAFLNENFLWNLGDQGYREIEGVGFGYFTNVNTLTETVKENKINSENIVSFHWDSLNQKLINTTEETRKLF